MTEREHEVAERAARGLTARSIAERLHIGVRTVETHLARIYRKLDLTSKQQLIRHLTGGLNLTPIRNRSVVSTDDTTHHTP